MFETVRDVPQFCENPEDQEDYDTFDDERENKTEKIEKISKTKLCLKYIKLKNCPNGSACPYAHGVHELTVSYKPLEWTNYFRKQNNSTGNSKINEVNTLLRPKTVYVNEKQDKIHIDKIINNHGRTLLIEACAYNNYQCIFFA